MRLQEVYSICRNVQESWCDLAFEEKKAAGGVTYYRLTNLNEIKALLSDLDAVSSFSDSIASIRKTSIAFEQTSGAANFEASTRNSLVAEYKQLENKVVTIVELFESMDYMQPSDGFDIKLPPEISLPDLSKCTRDLNTIFSTCPLLSSMDGTITFSAVDVGSVWLTFMVAGAAAAGMIGMVALLVNKALIIRSHYLTAKEQTEKIRSLQLGNDLLENSIKINEEIGKGLLTNICSELAEGHNISEPEDMERLKNSVQLLADWMSKGMEIYASVQAAPETKAVFAPVEMQSLSESVRSMLTDGTGKSETQ